jgi:hypothetical protein
MGTVLSFTRTVAPLPQRETPAGQAEVIIFPGIRIERDETGEPAPPAGSGDRHDGDGARRRRRKGS